MAKVGDLVRYLNTVGGGRIVRIDGQVAYVDEDGFENPVLLRECVVVTPASTIVPPSTPRFGAGSQAAPSTPPSKDTTPQRPKAETFVVHETPEGERLNIMLAYEPVDIKRLSTTTFEAVLVNDSNYYISYAYLTRANDESRWTLRHTDTLEPGVQMTVCEVAREDLAEMDHVAIQYFAYKLDKPFEAKTPALVDVKLDTTKFCKLHCFQPNMYFDLPVLAYSIVTDDRAARQLDIDPKQLRDALREKQAADKGHPGAAPRQKAKRKSDDILEVDLHISQLVDTTAGMSNADMLNLQIDTFRKVMDANLKNHGRKIIFIHGKGDGVLRKALLKELGYRYKEHDVQDASFQEYGFGATQVRIR